MLKMKKILSVALVVFMLLTTVAIGAYAVPANDAEVGLVLVSDKKEAEIVSGAKVTVTFYFEMKDYSQLMSDTKLLYSMMQMFTLLIRQVVLSLVTGQHMLKMQQPLKLTQHTAQLL